MGAPTQHAAARRRPHGYQQALLNLVGAEFATKDFGVVLNLSAGNHLLDLEHVERGGRVLVTAYHQDILECLMIFSTVLSVAVAAAAELMTFQLLDYLRWVEGTGTLTGICILQGLNVAGLSCL